MGYRGVGVGGREEHMALFLAVFGDSNSSLVGTLPFNCIII